MAVGVRWLETVTDADLAATTEAPACSWSASQVTASVSPCPHLVRGPGAFWSLFSKGTNAIRDDPILMT